MNSQSKRQSPPLTPIKVTVGIPAYNEEKTIKQLLQSVLDQPMGNCTFEEVIVEASGSTDATALRVADTIKSNPKVKLVAGKRRRGKSAALNVILQQAKGEVVVFIDGDLVLRSGCIQTLLKPLLSDERVGIATGEAVPLVMRRNFFGFASRFVRELHCRLCTHLMDGNLTPKVNGSFYALRKEAVEKFPFHVVSDDEYASWCAQKKGYKIIYVPDAIVYAVDPVSFRSFIEWQKRTTLGQMYIKKYFNYTVPTTKASVLLPVSVKLIGRYRRKPLQILTLIFLLGISMILAVRTFVRNEIPYMYG